MFIYFRSSWFNESTGEWRESDHMTFLAKAHIVAVSEGGQHVHGKVITITTDVDSVYCATGSEAVAVLTQLRSTK